MVGIAVIERIRAVNGVRAERGPTVLMICGARRDDVEIHAMERAALSGNVQLIGWDCRKREIGAFGQRLKLIGIEVQIGETGVLTDE